MFYPIWRLSEPGADNLGVACSEEGLVLGRTPLLERRDGRFVVRDPRDIQRLISSAYRMTVDPTSLLGGLTTVAVALNANDLLLARIAAVHLRIPDLPDRSARERMEVEDRLIKYAHQERAAKIGDSDWNPALHPHSINKASPDDPKHPAGQQEQKEVGADNFVRKTERQPSSRKRLRSGSLAWRYDVRCASLLSRSFVSRAEERSTLSR